MPRADDSAGLPSLADAEWLRRPETRAVFDALRAFHSVGVTCVISTHDEVVLDGAARVIHLRQGALE